MTSVSKTQRKMYDYENYNDLEVKYFTIANQEYHGCRCCFLSGLEMPGSLCAEQAIEKLLKSYLYHYKMEEKNIKNMRHRLSDVVIEVEKIQNLELDDNSKETIKRLEQYWDTKYPMDEETYIKTLENDNANYLMTDSDELWHIDKLFYHLLIRHPIIPEIKFLKGIFGFIGEFRRLPFHEFNGFEVEPDELPKFKYLLDRNIPLSENIKMITKENELFFKHLHSENEKD